MSRQFWQTFLIINLIGLLFCGVLLGAHFGLTGYLQKTRQEAAQQMIDNADADEEVPAGHPSVLEAVFAIFAVLTFGVLILVDAVMLLIALIRTVIRLLT